MPFAPARARISSTTPDRSDPRSSGCMSSSSRLPSIREMSMRSSIRSRRRLPLDSTVVMSSCCRGLSGPSSPLIRISLKPRMAVSGVRSSWLTLARKSVFAWLALRSSSIAPRSWTVRSATEDARSSRWSRSSARASHAREGGGGDGRETERQFLPAIDVERVARGDRDAEEAADLAVGDHRRGRAAAEVEADRGLGRGRCQASTLPSSRARRLRVIVWA